MKKNLVILAIIAVAIAALIFFTQPRHGKGSGTVALTGGGEDLQGRQAPDFELADLSGKKVKLSSFRGKAVVLNFWATWCVPCKTEMPWFAKLQAQYRDQGVEFVGVAMDENPNASDIAKFAKEVGVNYTILIGQDSTGDAYDVGGEFPVTFYINATGKIISENIGAPPGGLAEIEDNIKSTLAKKQEIAEADDQGDINNNQNIGKPAPDFELKTMDGKQVKLSDFHGKPVLLNFWATWCLPCREETPWLVAIQKEYRSQGLQIIGVASDQDSTPNDVKEFIKEFGLNYTVLLGHPKVEDAYGVQGYPTTVYIDSTGKVAAQVTGEPDDKSEIEDNIKRILGAPASTVASAANNVSLAGVVK